MQIKYTRKKSAAVTKILKNTLKNKVIEEYFN